MRRDIISSCQSAAGLQSDSYKVRYSKFPDIYLYFYLYLYHVGVVGIMINANNVVELMLAADKLGVTSVVTQCCAVIDKCPLDRVLEIISDASDIGLNDLAILESKVSRRVGHYSQAPLLRLVVQQAVQQVEIVEFGSYAGDGLWFRSHYCSNCIQSRPSRWSGGECHVETISLRYLIIVLFCLCFLDPEGSERATRVVVVLVGVVRCYSFRKMPKALLIRNG